MNIYKLLKKEHDIIQNMLDRMLQEGEINREAFRRFRTEIELHMEGEEEFLYPELEKIRKTKMKALESFTEHETLKFLISKVESAEVMEKWLAALHVLKEAADAHIKKEEKKVFDISEDVLNKARENEILSDYEQFKAQRTIFK